MKRLAIIQSNVYIFKFRLLIKLLCRAHLTTSGDCQNNHKAKTSFKVFERKNPHKRLNHTCLNSQQTNQNSRRRLLSLSLKTRENILH